MEITDYQPLHHARAAYALWTDGVGDVYPLGELDFCRATVGRASYDEGDGVVALVDGRVVGFGMLVLYRLTNYDEVGYGWCSISMLAVDRAHRRRGIGRALLAELERRLRALGLSEVQVGANDRTPLPAIPLAVPGAVEFFAACGYEFGAEAFGLAIPLAHRGISDASRRAVAEHGVTVESLTFEQLAPTLALMRREFKYWTYGMLNLLPADMDHVLIVRRGAEIIGVVQVFSPQSRHREGGVQHQPRFDGGLGALGGVGIAEAWRGRGLGRAMCEYAMDFIKERGGMYCYIEEVEPHVAPFYQKLGADIRGHYLHASKRL